MTVVFHKIANFPDDVVAWYTVQLPTQMITEFERFDQKDFPEHTEDLQVIYSVIHQMMHRGAKKYFFRNEGPADALPRADMIDPHENDFGLRLYCIRLTDQLVVLLNGDIKTEQKPQQCPNVATHFRNAQLIARALDRALKEGDVTFVGPDCLTDLEIEI